MDRFGRSFIRGSRGPKGDKGDDLINLLPKTVIHLLKTIEFDLSCTLTNAKDFKINERKEIEYWYSKSNEKKFVASKPAPLLTENWRDDGIIFPL